MTNRSKDFRSRLFGIGNGILSMQQKARALAIPIEKRCEDFAEIQARMGMTVEAAIAHVKTLNPESKGSFGAAARKALVVLGAAWQWDLVDDDTMRPLFMFSNHGGKFA